MIDIYDMLPVMMAVAEMWERHAPQQPTARATVMIPVDRLSEIPDGAIAYLSGVPYVDAAAIARETLPTSLGPYRAWVYRITYKPWNDVPLDDRYPLPKRIRDEIKAAGVL
jgi:hypothetical protein